MEVSTVLTCAAVFVNADAELCYRSCLSSRRKDGTDVTLLHFLYKLVIKTTA